MKKIGLTALIALVSTACFDYKRAVTTLTLGTDGQPHGLRMVLEDVTGDDDDCAESAEACAASVKEMLVSLEGSLAENGAQEVTGHFEVDGDELDMVLTSKLPVDAKLISDMGIEREEHGRKLDRLKERWVVSEESELGVLQGPPKKARPRVVHTFDSEAEPVTIQRWELHPRTEQVQWVDVADEEDDTHDLIARWPQIAQLLDVETPTP